MRLPSPFLFRVRSKLQIAADLLPVDLAAKMERRSRFARIHEIEGCGHAPPLMSAEQIKIVSDFLSTKVV